MNLSFPHQYAVTRRFTTGAPRTLSIVNDGSQVFFLRSQASDDPVLCLWRLDIASGQEHLLANPRSLNLEPSTGSDTSAEIPPAELARRERARESGSGIVSYSLSSDGRLAIFSLAGSLYVVNTQSESVQRIVSAPDVFDPRLSPNGSNIVYVSGQALHITSATATSNSDSGDRVLKSEQDPEVSWGRAEFIAGEEMNRTRGFWWSPDGDALLATRVDESPINVRWISDPANPDREPRRVRYPAAGTGNAQVDLALVRLDGSTKMIDWRQDQFEYLADVVWAPGGPPLIIRQTRDQRKLSIAQLDLSSMNLTEIHSIQDDHWVELVDGSPTWSGHGLLTIEDISEDDCRALRLNGASITPPELQVRSIIATRGDEALITASSDPTEVHLYVVSLSDGATRALTSLPGVHSATVGGTTLALSSSEADRSGTSITIHGWPTIENPPAQASPVRVGSVNTSLTTGPRVISHAESPVLTADPTYLELGPSKLCAALFLPQDHSDKTPLPVLLDPYGGPHAQRVLKIQNAHLVSQWFANQGFAVLVVDGRGTPGRGPRFERAVWGDLAQPVLDDQIEALDAAAQSHPNLDLHRVAIRGWSFGGYLAALAVMRRPDRFHAAIAGAPVTTWHLYDTHYTERYLGHPDQHPDNYDRSDLLLDAQSLDRPLLLIHGLADDNVVAAHTLRLSSALLAAGRSHQVLPLSGVTHMTPQAVVAENLLLLQRDFLFTNLVDNSTLPQDSQ